MTPLSTPYRNLLPPLATEELESLRLSVEAEGVREPCVATEDGRLLDGHNRLAVCPGAPVRTLAGSAAWTDEECKAWVFRNAASRRNLSPDQKAEVRRQQVELARHFLHNGWTEAAVAVALGKSQPWVSKYASIPIITGNNGNTDSRVKVPRSEWDAIKERADQGDTQAQIAADYGVTQSAIAKILDRLAGEAATAGATLTDACTVDDLLTLAGSGARFGCIYADPPWPYGNQATRAATDNHYPTMSLEDIAALPVAQLAAERAHCHLWTTNGFLRESFDLLQAWGFEYKSCFIWTKPHIGIGNYWRVSHEFMLLGVRGSLPFADRGLRSWLEADRGRHSSKPEQVRHLIERASPGPRLELFGRAAVPGWTVWGNEVSRDLFTQPPAIAAAATIAEEAT